MSGVPSNPKVYHITHIDNLQGIVAANCLISDVLRIENRVQCQLVGMSTIKLRRLREIKVTCHPDTMVGQYVPFYFCPRSIMLYVLHKGNRELTYGGGQEPIIHLQADFKLVVAWASQNRTPWALSNGNAGAYLSNFYSRPQDLNQINWSAVQSTDFRDPQIKEGKQAEFLIFERFPWTLIEKVGTINSTYVQKVNSVCANTAHQPRVEVQSSWYF